MENDYASALRASERVAWKLNDVLREDATFAFDKPFLPESLVSAQALPFLTGAERRTLNQIRAHGYLCMFGLVEEFILPFVLGRLQTRAEAEMTEVRALLAFAGEEAKHIELFRRFRRVFDEGFGSRCDVIGPPQAIGDHVLRHSELGVGLLVLHIEWMTQAHYVEMVHDDGSLEPRFRDLLHQHWVEESQHARIDGWVVESLATAASAEERTRAFDDYVALLDFFDQGLAQQVDHDLEALERATGRTWNDLQKSQFREAQLQSQRRTFLGVGVTHPRVRAALEIMHPAAEATLRELAHRYTYSEIQLR